ncbi:MAG TPA: Asp-tRNA(Asn)/Glu-tRNA(Gln) amidotransferase subunit GatB [Clostridia bacterium]|nr:Asp-tRNA(Asn)/Glu-tRNA(Gln) amidotransferase subunit GatB [Clostridia bacterium]
MSENERYEAVIGLEVHVELGTKTKIFCNCPTTFGGEPNTQVCPVCLGLPGVLPVLNEKVLRYALRAALALNCEVARFSRFDRKNYPYPDLPKNYQISQYDLPLARNGYVEVNGRRIRIKRLHLEEDAGKLLHEGDGAQDKWSLVDYNRAGVPLAEIVSEPDIRTPSEARAYLESLKAILQYIGVSDCKMEEGSLRCDTNVSVRRKGETGFGTRTELKNLNSFKAVEKSLEYEIARQISVLEDGEEVVQETRAWDESREITVPLRGKEEAHDYRYFPDPDLVPVVVDQALLDEIRKEIPELPSAKRQRFIREYGIPEYDAGVLTADKRLADFFDECASRYRDPKVVSNWLMGEYLKYANATGLSFAEIPVTPEGLVELLNLQDEGVISGKIAKTVFEEMLKTGERPSEIVKKRGLVQISDENAIYAVVDEVIASNPNVVRDYLGGKEKAFGFLVGQVMKATGGKANPAKVNAALKKRLGKE